MIMAGERADAFCFENDLYSGSGSGSVLGVSSHERGANVC